MDIIVHTAETFKAKYPLDLRSVIATPMIFRESVLRDAQNLPYPGIAMLRDLAEFAGYGYGALRTALSRAKASGEILALEDDRGTTRFRITDLTRSVGKLAKSVDERTGGFLIAVFSFKAEEEASRSKVREALKYFGFKRIAQNTYINGLIDSSGLEAALREHGVGENLYLFRCTEVENPSLAQRLAKVFDIEGRRALLESFLADLEAFLGEGGLDAPELGRRLFYSGPVFHGICFTDEPPFPSSFLPEGYPIARLRSYYRKEMAEHGSELRTYYLKFSRD